MGVLGPVTLKGLGSGMWDLSKWKWSYKVGVDGETKSIYTEAGSGSVGWDQGVKLAKNQPVTWYKVKVVIHIAFMYYLLNLQIPEFSLLPAGVFQCPRRIPTLSTGHGKYGERSDVDQW